MTIVEVRPDIRFRTTSDGSGRHYFGVLVGYGEDPADALADLTRQARTVAKTRADSHMPDAPMDPGFDNNVMWPFEVVGVHLVTGPVRDPARNDDPSRELDLAAEWDQLGALVDDATGVRFPSRGRRIDADHGWAAYGTLVSEHSAPPWPARPG